MSILQDESAESSVLGCLLKTPSEYYLDVADYLTEHTFSNHYHSELYKIISETIEQGLEHRDVSYLLSKSKKFNKKIIDRCLADACIPAHLNELAGKIRKLEVARILFDQFSEKSKVVREFSGNESISDILSLLEFDLESLLTKNTKDTHIARNLRELLQERLENPVDQVGLPTGYPIYDAAIGGGLRDGGVYMVGARNKVGKSSWLLNVAINLASKNITVIYIDTEMNTDEQQFRVLSNMSGIPINSLETGQFGSETFWKTKAFESLDTLEKVPFHHINVAGMAFEEQVGLISRLIRKTKQPNENGEIPKVVLVYDYLKVVQSTDISNALAEHQLLGFILSTLHNMAVRYKIPTISACQLNRDGINAETTATAAGTDRILWICTSFAIFKPKSEEETTMDGVQYGNRKMVMLANRFGPGLDDHNYINYVFEKDKCKIIETKTRFQINDEKKLINEPSKN